MPCFNHAAFIEEAVESVLNQTYTNIELIIIDDASTDPAVRPKIKSLSKKDQRIKAIFLDNNSGPSAARNLGIEASSGTYILPLDADDRIAPSYIDKAVKIIESDAKIGVVYCEADFFGTAQGKWGLPAYSAPDILISNMVFCSSLYRKSDWKRFGGYNENMRDGLEDWDFWLNFTADKKTFIRIPETLFLYRQHEPNSSRNEAINREKSAYLLSTIFANHSELYLANIHHFFDQLPLLTKTHGLAKTHKSGQLKTLFKRKVGRYTLSLKKKIKKRGNG